MPYLSKRKKQLRGAQNAKRQKRQDNDLQREQQNGLEEQDERGGSLPSVESSQNDEDGASSEESDA